MAKEIKITMSDSEFEVLQEAYAKNDDSVSKEAVLYKDDDTIPEGKKVGDVKTPAVDEDYVKTRWMNFLKAKIRKYDEKVQEVTYSSFNPS